MWFIHGSDHKKCSHFHGWRNRAQARRGFQDLNYRILVATWVLWLGLGTTPLQAGEPVRLTDFAYAADISVEGEGAVYRLDLPEAVYTDAVRPDLGDLRVFNAAGSPVPHALIGAKAQSSKSIVTHELPLFPLYADQPMDVQNIRVWIEAEQGRADIHINRPMQGDPSPLSGYILDARAISTRVDRFTIDWASRDFLIRVNLEASDDLEHWRSLVSGAVLADLHHLEQHLEKNQISLAPVKARYYRLRFLKPAKAITLNGVRAHGTHRVKVIRHQELPLQVSLGEEPGDYLFEIPPALSPSHMRLRLPEINSLVSAVLESRPDQNKPWRQRRRLTLYRLRQNGVELENDDVPMARSRDRFWRLRIDRSTGGLGTGLPDIHLYWRPHELRFVARGQGPYSLAWGSAKPFPGSTGQTDLILHGSGLSPLRAEITGDIRRPADDSVLRKPVNWRQWLLWGVLAGGALLLVWMALRLFRQMQKDTVSGKK